MPAVFDPQSPSFQHLLAQAREEAPSRDALNTPLTDLIAQVKALGIGAARLPVALGGAGLNLRELFAAVFDLAVAEPNLAHVLRNHFLFVEKVLAAGKGDATNPVIQKVLAGQLVGLSQNENSSNAAGASVYSTTLQADGQGHWVLHGEKAYSTGNLYFDHLVVLANSPEGALVQALVPADRQGITHVDDWDGMGQRLTGSGTTRFEQVHVHSDELLPLEPPERSRPYPATYAQLWLTTVVAGILTRALQDITAVIHARKRNYFHGLATRPADDPAVQQTLGRIAASVHAAKVLVTDAAAQLETAWQCHPTQEQARHLALSEHASLAALQAKIVVDDIAQWATSEMFELGGASATTRAKGLDRHWRNIRTLASHNPRSYKERILGRHLLHGEAPPNDNFF